MPNKLVHYGTPQHSGRYPWGSGGNAQQRNKSFLGYVNDLTKKGLSEVEIARGAGMTTTQLRAKKSLANAAQRQADVAEALRYYEKGYSKTEIGKRMGRNESSVRSLLNPALQVKSEITNTTATMLKEAVNAKKYKDVGAGVEHHIGISRTKLKTSIAALTDEGYIIHYIQVEQPRAGKKTTVMVLSAPGTSYSEVYKNKGDIKTITDYSEDGGRSFLGLEPIKSINSKRLQIRYAEEGGTAKDGVIELRRGVNDISLGNAKYAQVRIGVDDTHYLKGMAMYSDDLPNGVDMIFNTNKSNKVSKIDTLKVMAPDMKDLKAEHIKTLNISKEEQNSLLKKGVADGSISPDPDNPFGATVRQRPYTDAKGNTQISTLNIVNEEGDWGKWSKTLSSQMLSKQSLSLAKKQLSLAYDLKKDEYHEIKALTNPAVRKKLLDSFSDGVDSASVHLKAASLPRQASHVILPFPKMKETEIYAPNYRDGERVALIRYPHGGTFEIPELTVNNKYKPAKNSIGNAKDGIGINHKVAEVLSGADFDGDAVLVIPNKGGLVKTSKPLQGLKDFDPRTHYPAYEGMSKISPRTKQMKMGDVSNLITDMTIKGADSNEVARAVRHSMVIIDSEKHNLNYKQSHIDNGISELKKKYQGGERRGAATLISKAASEARVPTRKMAIDPTTGKKVYTHVEDIYVDKKGKLVQRTEKSTKIEEAQDAFTLSSGTPMEAIYATHANKLKALANDSRKTSAATKFIAYSPSAKKTYEPEVSTLKAKLNIALKNKPLERQALLLSSTVVAAKKNANPDMSNADLKRIKGQALAEARTRTGAKKQKIEITTKEWSAIQAGAISTNTLIQVLNNTDLDKVKQLATPRDHIVMSPAKINKAQSMLISGYTQSEVADALGISTSSLTKVIK